jgi:hypothetical protein
LDLGVRRSFSLFVYSQSTLRKPLATKLWHRTDVRRRLWNTELKPQGWTDSARIDEVMRPPMTELRADTDAKDNDGRTLQHLAAISRS